jgi:glutamate racemase
VVALACTHFPLLRAELEARAPRPVLWLDSGEAVARRVQTVSGCTKGRAGTDRAAFTDAGAVRTLAGAFTMRGFSQFCAIGPAPDFSLALHSPPLSI